MKVVQEGAGQEQPDAAQGALQRSMLRRALETLASLKLTLLVLAAIGAGIVIAYVSETPTTWALAIPLAAFALNLIAAVIINPLFRRKTSLLIFHLALVVIIVLIAAGRLTYLKGQLELAEGEVFDGELTQEESGPWHPRHLNAVRFSNEGFTISYAKGVRRGATRNQVTWVAPDGSMQRSVIGDQDPLVLSGYRFYTSHNKGFAPTFTWYAHSSRQLVTGTVHLPAYPMHEHNQAIEWTPPNSKSSVWVMLQFDEVILDPAKPSEFRQPSKHQIVVRVNEERHELKPGDRIRLEDGVLEYNGLRIWMGYTVFYDFTLPWLLVASVLAVISLAWHFWKKFFIRPWDKPVTGAN